MAFVWEDKQNIKLVTTYYQNYVTHEIHFPLSQALAKK